MNNVLNQILHFLQQGIAAIFHFVQLIWNWSIDQIGRLLAVPWQDWPVLKLILLILRVVAGQSHRRFAGAVTAVAVGWLIERTAG